MLEALQNQTSLLGLLMHFWVPHQQESLPDWGKWKEKHEQSSWALLHHCNTQMRWGYVGNQGRNKGVLPAFSLLKRKLGCLHVL